MVASTSGVPYQNKYEGCHSSTTIDPGFVQPFLITLYTQVNNENKQKQYDDNKTKAMEIKHERKNPPTPELNIDLNV